MVDLIFISAIVVFFLIAIGYVAFCDLLQKKENRK